MNNGDDFTPKTTKGKDYIVKIVILIALFVGGATILGGAFGLVFSKSSRQFCDAALSFAAGVMLAAAMLGLILPSLEYGGKLGFVTTVFGIFLGAFCVHLMDMLVPYVPFFVEGNREESFRRVCLFVMAIALHNLPEGIASGVGLGTDDVHSGILIATAIALQNLPEGFIVSVSLRGVGVGRFKSFLIAATTGIIEILGCLLGYFAVNISIVLLPLILALAGGTMLYVISEEMIPETHSGDSGRLSTYFLLGGFSLILIFDALL